MMASVELLRDQAMVPAQKCLWRGNRGHLLQACATDRVRKRRQTTAFGVGQTQPPATKLCFEDAVFRL
jgi:hypothetical protein